MRCAVPLTTICGSCSSRNTCAAARLAGLLTLPMAMHTLSRVAKRRAITPASSGLPASSPTTRSICRPSTPPAALRAFTTISMPVRRLCPCAAALPLIGPKAPILIGPGPCARACEPSSAAAAAALPDAMNFLRSNAISSLSSVGPVPEIAGAHVLVREQLGAAALHPDGAGLHHIPAIGKLQREVRILLDQQHRDPGVAEHLHRAHHLRYQQRREPQRRLIQQQELRPGHHGAAEGEHLLLAAGQRARRLLAALAQERKALHGLGKAPLHFLAVPQQISRGEQVLLDRELREDAPALRDVHQAERRDAVGSEPCDRAP